MFHRFQAVVRKQTYYLLLINPKKQRFLLMFFRLPTLIK